MKFFENKEALYHFGNKTFDLSMLDGYLENFYISFNEEVKDKLQFGISYKNEERIHFPLDYIEEACETDLFKFVKKSHCIKKHPIFCQDLKNNFIDFIDARNSSHCINVDYFSETLMISKNLFISLCNQIDDVVDLNSGLEQLNQLITKTKEQFQYKF